MDEKEILNQGREIIEVESKVLAELSVGLDSSFVEAVGIVTRCRGCVLTTGAGTSASVARRLAHLLATCGLASFFVHPSDALHGASALIRDTDVVIAFSKAGKSEEINGFVEIARKRRAKIISLTWSRDSKLAGLSDILCITQTNTSGEGDGVLPLGSTVAASAYSDALCLMAKRLMHFDLSQLKETHPSGGTSDLLK